MTTKRIKVLQNCCSLDTPTIKITSQDLDWQAAYDRYICGKPPTSASGWKEGGTFFFLQEVETTEPKSIDSSWDSSYWKAGDHIYDHWIKKFDCTKCGKERTAAICLSCINIAAEKIRKERAVIDVLAQTEAEKALLNRYGTLNPELYRAFTDTYGSINAMFGQLNRFCGFLQKALEEHGGQKHETVGCQECITDKRKWLEKNHPDWRTKSNETGCCTLCVERAYKQLSSPPPPAPVKPAVSTGKAAPQAVSL